MAPASVFGRLLKGVKPHLAKLQRDNRGAHYAIQARLEDILSLLPAREAFPRTLNLEQQGLFSLGYYHQRAHDRAQARKASERRRQERSPDAIDASDLASQDPEENSQEEQK